MRGTGLNYLMPGEMRCGGAAYRPRRRGPVHTMSELKPLFPKPNLSRRPLC
jgi:hypothetical protein